MQTKEEKKEMYCDTPGQFTEACKNNDTYMIEKALCRKYTTYVYQGALAACKNNHQNVLKMLMPLLSSEHILELQSEPDFSLEIYFILTYFSRVSKHLYDSVFEFLHDCQKDKKMACIRLYNWQNSKTDDVQYFNMALPYAITFGLILKTPPMPLLFNATNTCERIIKVACQRKDFTTLKKYIDIFRKHSTDTLDDVIVDYVVRTHDVRAKALFSESPIFQWDWLRKICQTDSIPLINKFFVRELHSTSGWSYMSIARMRLCARLMRLNMDHSCTDHTWMQRYDWLCGIPLVAVIMSGRADLISKYLSGGTMINYIEYLKKQLWTLFMSHSRTACALSPEECKQHFDFINETKYSRMDSDIIFALACHGGVSDYVQRYSTIIHLPLHKLECIVVYLTYWGKITMLEILIKSYSVIQCMCIRWAIVFAQSEIIRAFLPKKPCGCLPSHSCTTPIHQSDCIVVGHIGLMDRIESKFVEENYGQHPEMLTMLFPFMQVTISRPLSNTKSIRLQSGGELISQRQFYQNIINRNGIRISTITDDEEYEWVKNLYRNAIHLINIPAVLHQIIIAYFNMDYIGYQ